MTIFLTLLGKIVPLYFSIVLGLLSTLVFKCHKDTIAKILLYLLAPLIVFNATLSVKLDASVLFLPLFFFLLSTILAFSLLYIFKKIWHDNTANLLAFSTATGNTGNIGIPLAILFLEPHLVHVFIFTVLASILYQNSVGYYITAKGDFSARESIKKVLRLPVIYAFILGIIFNLLGLKLPEVFASYATYLKGAYSIFGMMLLGMGMEHVHRNKLIDFKFISIALSIKFLLWPGIILGYIFLDKHYWHFLNDGFYMIMFLFSIVPLAGNTVTIATLLDVKPEKMSVAVLISTLISLVYIPFALYLYTR
ncbi:AEC family transporter [Sulfurospirillum sp. 1612]|uniref:AEC family transporter n=1 Tax=Sulfurospirillum sp. 1612 TaxID=3094835 RepID=UPI002F933742